MTVHLGDVAAAGAGKDSSRSARREMISFVVRGQGFCVDIFAVREIRGWSKATPLPETPAYMCGVVNLRGIMLPIIDLAARLGYGITTPSARNAIVVVQVGRQLIGLMVDGVSEILSVAEEEIQAAPQVGSQDAAEFVSGILPTNDQMITCLRLEALIDTFAQAA